MPHEAKNLLRDPHDWATDNGWVSRRRALNLAAKIEAVAIAIEGHDEECPKELRAIAKALAPTLTPVQRRLSRDA